jgi:Mn2+/Fe2+ NRAMP family transporter
MSTSVDTAQQARRGRLATGIGYFRQSGPAWLAGGLNIGGASVTNAVILASATGLVFGWVVIPAVIAIWAATYACVKIAVVSGKNPLAVMRDEVHPALAWINGGAVLLVNLVFYTINIVLGASALQLIFPQLGMTAWGVALVGVVALMSLLPGRIKVAEKLLQVFLYVLALTYVVALFVVPVDWSGVGQMFTFTLPSDSTSVLLFTAVLGAALAINVPTIQSYGTVERKWGTDRLPLIRFETGMLNLLLVFVSLAVIIVVGSTLYPAGITATSAVTAAESLRPVTGDLSAILFAVGLLGAVLTTAVVQTSVAGYVVSDVLRWPSGLRDRKFKAVQVVMVLIGFSIPFIGWNPFDFAPWGAAFNSTFMPIGVGTWWYLVNKSSLMGEHRAGKAMNTALAVSMLICLVTAVRFWFVTFS